MKTIGVLAFQGDVIEHKKKLEQVGVCAKEVRYPRDLQGLDGIILPGGESTCIYKQLVSFGLEIPLKKKLESGLPAWGTCAGTILLGKEVAENDIQVKPLGLVDIRVWRNAYGSQLDSFICRAEIPEVSPQPLRLIFIRAPQFIRLSDSVIPLATIVNKGKSQLVAARQKHFLVTAFHPELNDDNCEFHRYFADNFCTK